MFVEKFGISDKQTFKKILQSIIKVNGYDENVTLLQLHQKTGKTLFVNACNINTYEHVVFSHLTHQSTTAIDCLMASISIPFVFTPQVINNEHYVDGGLICNILVNEATKSFSAKNIIAINL